MLDQLFDRVDLGVLSEVLLYGEVPEGSTDSVSCEEKLKAAEGEMQKQLDEMDLERRTNEEVQDIFSGFQANIGPIYFELGMRAGVRLYRVLVEGESEIIKQQQTAGEAPEA